jgi:hypothetical protein
MQPGASVPQTGSNRSIGDSSVFSSFQIGVDSRVISLEPIFIISGVAHRLLCHFDIRP